MTELARISAELLALHRHIRDTDRRAKPALARGPRFAHPIARRFHHRVVDFLELHARSAHADQRDERSEHFVCALADLVNSRIAHHALQRKIGHICRAAMDLEHIVDAFPKPLGREHFQHRRLEHVIFQTAVDE